VIRLACTFFFSTVAHGLCCCSCWIGEQAALEEARDSEMRARSDASSAKAAAHEAEEARLAAEDEHLTARVTIKQLQVRGWMLSVLIDLTCSACMCRSALVRLLLYVVIVHLCCELSSSCYMCQVTMAKQERKIRDLERLLENAKAEAAAANVSGPEGEQVQVRLRTTGGLFPSLLVCFSTIMRRA
jgi:hypothetical protein